MGFAPRDPRDFPRAKTEGNPEGRGVQNPWPREISRAEGMDFPVPPESGWSTDILSSLPGKALIGFHRYLMKNSENQQIPMNERFAFDDICVFGYFVSAYFCIFVQDPYLYFICLSQLSYFFPPQPSYS